MKWFLIRLGVYLVTVAAMLVCLNWFLVSEIKTYPIAISVDNSLLKQSGAYFLNHIPEDNVLILGASELNTTMIASHPANLMKNGRGGLIPNIVGRGSCQAIVHASILAAAENLSDRKVVIILSPQSFVPDGIAPDMYFANFSEQQFCKILLSNKLPIHIKDKFKSRFLENLDCYSEKKSNYYPYELSSKSRIARMISLPYFWTKEKLLTVRDLYRSYLAYLHAPPDTKETTLISWQDEFDRMLDLAEKESDNNNYGILNDYYSVNIGRKLEKFRNRDADLSYDISVEYKDLELLLDICAFKEISPLIISVPLHGEWSDYTGFTSEKRMKYYRKINSLVQRYDAQLLDLSEKEYEPYFLCDIMHLGWIGWLEVNENISRFYHSP